MKLKRVTDGIMEYYYEHEVANKIRRESLTNDDVKGVDDKDLTEIPGDITNATTRTLHGTMTSLCEQCLTPASLHPAAPIAKSEGTSTSLPPP